MSNKITIDMKESSSKTTAFDALEKLGRLAVKIQEDEAKIQRMTQSIIYPDTFLTVDPETIRNAVADYAPESIIPEGYFEKTQEYQQKSLEVLQSINENTANLYTLVELINQSNEKQDELIMLLMEILSLAKANNKSEADSKFRKIMEKVNTSVDNVDSMIKITGWATAVYRMVLPLLK